MWNNDATTNNYLNTTLDENAIKGKKIRLSALVKMKAGTSGTDGIF